MGELEQQQLPSQFFNHLSVKVQLVQKAVLILMISIGTQAKSEKR